MARYLWKGSLSFGLVEIPVGLLSAESREHELSFSLLDRRDFAPIGYQRYNKKTEKPVEWEDIVKGYEHDEGEYVILTDDDFKRANVRATQSIEILSFVDAAEVDPIYFETPYYVVPLKAGSKAYALMRDTLRRTGKMGIARYVMKTRQHVAALTVRDGVLLLQNLRYAHEVVPVKDLELDKGDLDVAVSKREIDIAEKLVEGMSGTFRPEEFKDEYYDDLMALIRKRAKAGQTESVEAPLDEAPIRGTRVVDLLPLLEKSLAGAGRSPGAARTEGKKAPRVAPPRTAKRAVAAKAAASRRRPRRA
jgi:DNA end-binding protein Ku